MRKEELSKHLEKTLHLQLHKKLYQTTQKSEDGVIFSNAKKKELELPSKTIIQGLG